MPTYVWRRNFNISGILPQDTLIINKGLDEKGL